MESIEKFISANRKAFDQATPPQEVWENIARTFDGEALIKRKKKSLFIRSIASIAAMLLLVCTAGILVYQSQVSSRNNYSRINPDLAKQQVAYASLIHEKLDTLSAMSANNPKLYQEFSTVIDKMQANYKQLKIELIQSPNQERTLEAMINNLKMQIEVLNQQLAILNSVHQEEKRVRYEQL
ncbi:hypothetical protein GCM10023231_36400 [Olivibacter ginsenosidimutans]|uniref:Anti-sigma factor n=1 Tax=Olivibacter ginsenosidimutans TaxID=1176537 RepID=A0ABP9C3F3_9SPHI